MFEELETEIKTLIEPLLDKIKAEIIELNIKKINNTIYLQIIIDKETGGISIEECSMVNRELSAKLGKSSIRDKDYVIEVSSPGVDRPIKTSKDFKRVIGRHVNIFTSDNLNNPKTYEGIVKKVSEDKIIILPIKKSKKQKITTTTEAITLMIKNITKAKQVI